MKLRTKILSGFGAMLVLTGILGYVSLSLTDNMSVYSAEAALIDNARTTLVQAQVACTFYTSTNEQRYADIALQRIRDAEALFRRAMDMDSSESNRSGLEAAADDSEKLHALLERLVARQQEANALKRRADEILAETAVKYDDIQARMERLVRSEKMDADIDTFVALNNIRTRVDIEVRTGVASFSMKMCIRDRYRSPQDGYRPHSSVCRWGPDRGERSPHGRLFSPQDPADDHSSASGSDQNS